MRPIRCIHLDDLKYKYISIVQTQNTMVVRVLYPMLTYDGYQIGNSNDILTDKQLLWEVLDLNGQLFQIVGEGKFDLNNPTHRQWFKANANICFVVNAAFPNGVISVIPQHNVAPTTYERTPDWARRLGYTVVAQLYCWSDTDDILNSAGSFAVDNQGQVFTNIDPSRLVHVDKQWMQREDRSDFVTLQYNIDLQSDPDNQCIRGTLTCLNNGNKVNTNGTYLIECSAGYIPVRELRVVDGIGEFVWYPLMLPEQLQYVRLTVKDVGYQPCCERLIKVSKDDN